MSIAQDAKKDSTVTCAMDGNNYSIIPTIIAPINAQKKSAKKDNVPITIHKNKEE